MLASTSGWRWRSPLSLLLASILIISSLLLAYRWRGHFDYVSSLSFQTAQPQQHTSDALAWLKDRGFTNRRHPIITIGDAKYIPALRHLRGRLDNWHYGNDLVVLCLDEECASDANFHGYHVLLDPDRATMEQVAEVKVCTFERCGNSLRLTFVLAHNQY
jgi:hypothetical protein